jgi:23S rRNA pseudouridine2605 synthase
MERIQKIIANCGITSRRKAEELIKEGKVKVNGEVCTIGDKADISKDEIEVEGHKLKRVHKLYLMFNKPADCLTTLPSANVPRSFKTIFHYIKLRERIIPVGRLDYNTSGLLLLTNDGDFANKVMHPRYNVEKTYEAVVDKIVKEADLMSLRKGFIIEERKIKPRVKQLGPRRVEIRVHEGKKRMIRKMLDKLDFKVSRLHRVGVGRLSLGNLKEGEYRELSEEEVKSLQYNHAK